MTSELKREIGDLMSVEGVIGKILNKFLCDSIRKVSQKFHDIYSNVFDDSINNLAPKYSELTKIHIDNFLYEPPVNNLILSYIEHPEKYIDCSEKKLFNERLLKEFIILFEEDYFSKEEAREIIVEFVDILDNNIQENPDLKNKLILHYAKDTNQELKKHIEENRIYLKSFLTLEEFFARNLESTDLLNHKYHFVGRSEILSQLDSFIESDKKIALLPGRGGIGKSRILFEFGKRFESKHDEWELRYVSEIPLTRDSIRELPERKCVLVVDDAHRREDIITLLETAQQANILIKFPIKVILAFRPYGLNYIKSSYNRCRFSNRETEEILEVQGLNRKEKEELGKRILGQTYYQYLDALIQVAKDSTIVLVIGARLIAENRVRPALLEQDKEFQDVVFSRFQEDILKGITDDDDLDERFCRDLLSIISILSPIREENDFIERVAKHLQVKKSKLKRAIDTLKRCKALYPVGSKLRITPDVLSDYILHNSCVTSDGYSTGYSQEIFEAFGDMYLKNILDNLSELDWRITKQNEETDLLFEIWGNIEEEFKNSPNIDRVVLLEKLEKVAYFQPQRILDLIKYIISNPLNKSERDYTPLYGFTHKDVLGKIPSLLKNVSYNPEYLKQSCEILWNLAKKEIEIEHGGTASNHALTVLIDLAKYQMYKPLEYSSQIITFVENEINNHIDSKYTCSLLEMLDPILDKEIIFNKSIGFEIKFIPYPIPYENTKEIRRKAILLIGDQLKSESTKVALAALKILLRALESPTGFYGRKVSTDEIESWLPEQMEILNIIEKTSKTTTDSILRIQIKSSLSWYARQTSQPEVKDKIYTIIKSLPEDFDTKLLRAIWYHYDRDYDDIDGNQAKIFQEINEVAREFLYKCDNEGKQIFGSLNEITAKFEISEITIHPADFLVILSTTDYKIACEVCNHIISDASKPLANYLDFFLSGIREKDESIAIKLTETAANSNDPILCRSIAEGYAYRGWTFKLKDEEIGTIKQLLTQDTDTRILAIESLGHFPNTLRDKAIELALGVEIGDNEKIADTYCGIFNSKYSIPLESLDKAQIKHILKKISQVQVLEKDLYDLNTFLTYCSTRIPEELVDFLLERVDLSKKIEHGARDRFQPLPYNGFYDKGLNGISLSPHYENILRKVRDRSINSDQKESSWLPKLYSYISNNFSLTSLEVLNEWINTKNEEKITTVGLLVKEAPSEFVFSHPDFVSNLLTNAQEASDDCYIKVRSNLLRSVEHGGRIGIAGQPCPQDEKTRDRAQEFMEMYPVGSTTWSFYKWLSEEAKKSIKHWLEKDEEMLEE